MRNGRIAMLLHVLRRTMLAGSLLGKLSLKRSVPVLVKVSADLMFPYLVIRTANPLLS